MTEQSSNYKSNDKWAGSRITSRQDSLGCTKVHQLIHLLLHYCYVLTHYNRHTQILQTDVHKFP